MGWLVTAELVSLLAGVLLLMADKKLHKLGEFMNKPFVYVDNLVNGIKIPAGIVLVLVGGWFLSVALRYPSLWVLGAVGAFLLLFGLLYLFFPAWLGSLSLISNQLLFSTDDFVMGARKSIGVILIVCALYIFFAVYLSLK